MKIKYVASENIVRSVHPDIHVPEDISLPEFFRRNVNSKTLDDVFTICGNTGVQYTRRQTLNHVMGFGQELRRLSGRGLDLSPGDHVGILLPNCAEFFAIFLGVIQGGFVPVLLNPAYTNYELDYLIKTTDIRGIITTPKKLEETRDLLKSYGVDLFVTFGPAKDDTAALDYFEMVDSARFHDSYLDEIADEEIGRKSFDGNKTAFITLSSGTTGLPKGVMISHKNLIAQVLGDSAMLEGGYGQETVFCIFPRFHIGGIFATSVAFFKNWEIISIEKFVGKDFVDVMKTYAPTMLWAPPAVLSFINVCPDLGSEDFRQMHTVLVGSASTGSSVIEKLRAKIGSHIFVQEVYGASEASCLVLILPRRMAGVGCGSSGCVAPNLMVKVADLDTGKALGPNQEGEICVKGPLVCNGYYKNGEATKAAIDSDNWLHTGDVGYYDVFGLFHIVSRIKDMINVQGFKVSPEEIENVIRTHPKVVDAVVFGIPDNRFGEVPRAMVAAKDESLTSEEICELVERNLVAYKHLRGGVKFVPELPTGSTGKVLRREARRLNNIL